MSAPRAERTAPGARAEWLEVHVIAILAGSAVMLMLATGMRQSMGLFMGPLNRDIGLSAADFTLAIAVQNIVWGLSQPVVGAIADRWGCRPVTVAGAVCGLAGYALAASAHGPLAFLVGAGLFVGVALACTASSMAMTASARAVSDARRSVVLGAVSAVGSLGTLVCALLAQMLIGEYGWRVAMVLFVALAAATIPAAWYAGGSDRLPKRAAAPGEAVTLGAALSQAFRRPAYVVMTIAYFVCGLQLAFLVTHLPNYLEICGLDPLLGAQALAVIGAFNVAGCYLAGWLGARYPRHRLLGGVYVLRSLAIAVYFLIPPSPATTLLFAAIMGTLWLSVVPLIGGHLAQMFGLRFMATLFGIAFVSHQIGSFAGALGGGLIFNALGSYDLAWQWGVAIGLAAGIAQMLAGDRARPTPRAPVRAQPATA